MTTYSVIMGSPPGGSILQSGAFGSFDKQEMARVPKGTSLDPEILNQIVGRTASATALEALALELVLKVRLSRAGVPVRKMHNHADLFAKLPASDKKDAEERYQARRHPAMRATLAEVLTYSANVFEDWRYMHEHHHVQASMAEMQRAFEALDLAGEPGE
jgi:hypothetical protein